MVSRNIERVWRTTRQGVLGSVLVLGLTAGAAAQDSANDQLTDLIERIDRLERDKQSLEDRLETVEKKAVQETSQQVQQPQQFAALDEPTRQGAAEPNLSTNDAGDSAETAAKLDGQGKSLSALQKSFKAFQDKAGEKKYPNITMNGVFQADSVWVHQDADSLNEFGRIEDGGGFRRARLSAKGSVAENINYLFQTDIGTGGIGRPSITDIWVEETDVPYLGTVRVGQWKQPFSLEVVSSFRYTTFMERSSMFQAFTPFRRLGIGFYDHSEDLNMTWAASGFHSGQDQYGDSYTNNQGYGTSERVTFLPYWDCDGSEYVHVGFGHYFNAPANHTTVFRSIPEIFVGAQGNGATGTSGQPIPGALNGVPFFVSTGNINVDFFNVLGAEFLYVEGPVSFQSEAMVNVVSQGGGGGTAYLPGAYASLGYFLTGEHRPYDRKAGAIDRIIPTHNMKFCGDNGNGYGWGAWEVAGRFSYLDLNDNGILGGTLMDTTLGVNWFLNPYLKVVFNWVHAMPDSPVFAKSQTDFFGTRAQVDF